MKEKFIQAYMDVAQRFSELSTARRLKVGAIVVKEDKIISIGYNGTPAGWDNNCEYEEEVMMSEFGRGTWLEKTGQLKTRPEVIHAERNALDKLAKGNGGGADATMFITHAPCLECAKSIYTTGIRQIFYRDDYRDRSGVEFLEKCQIAVKKI